jgi:hypothetical protein
MQSLRCAADTPRACGSRLGRVGPRSRSQSGRRGSHLRVGAAVRAAAPTSALPRSPGCECRASRPRDARVGRCDARSHDTSDDVSIGGSADVVERCSGPCSMACPRPWRASSGSWSAGCEARGKAQGLPFHPGGYRRGEDRTGELLEPSLMPREAVPRRWVVGVGCRDWPGWSGRRRPSTSLSPE